jgi:ABC-2 type transport system permease protein
MARPGLVVGARVARASSRSAALWGAVFGLVVFASAQGFASTYTSVASRRQLALSLGTNQGVQALFGPTRAIDTVGGFAAWRSLGLVTLAATRRRAVTMAAGVFGVAFVLRLVAESGSGVRWMRWLTPLGWVGELHPLTGSNPAPLVPILACTIVVGAIVVYLAGARDVGEGVVRDRDVARARTALLNTPTGLALRLTRSGAIGWVASLGVAGFVLGLVAKSAGRATAGSSQARKILARLGAHGGGALAYLGVALVFVATVLALAAASQVGATREEEAEGRLENLLARPVHRTAWLGGRLLVDAAALLLAGVTAGVGAWAGAALENTGVGIVSMLEAGVALVPVALFVLGIGTLVYGFAPRAAASVAYGIVAWSFLLELISSVVDTSHWFRDLSVFHHLAPAPAAPPSWVGAGVLTAIGLAAAGIGSYVLTRRDLAES